MSEKLQKVLARGGFGSRREIEVWISEGRIRINNDVAKLGDRISETDRILLDGKPVSSKRLYANERKVIIYNKDVGKVCTRQDPEGRPTIFKDLPNLHGARWISVGRLDINTSGLLILTTDGELANRLMHPKYEVEREYLVRVLGKVEPQMLEQLLQGVDMDGELAKFEGIQDIGGGSGANHWYKVMLKTGKNREVRRLWESQGLKVARLSRVRYGTIDIPKSLRKGKYIEIDVKEQQPLLKLVGLQQEKPELKKHAVKKKGLKSQSAKKKHSLSRESSNKTKSYPKKIKSTRSKSRAKS